MSTPIADVFFGVTFGDQLLEQEAKRAGDKAGASLAQNMQASIKKAFSGEALGKGLVQGLGLAGGLGIANVVGEVKDAFVGTIESAAEFERGMLNIQSITKNSDESLAAMGDTVLDLGAEFGQSAKTMTDALYDISSSGFQGADALDILEASTKAATAGLSTTGEAAAGITAVLNAYGLSAEDAAGVSDVLFQTVNRGVVDFSTLSSEIGKTTALAAPLGVSLEEVAAGIAVMTRAGIDAENATTQLNAIMSSMLKPSNEAAELAKKLGIEWSAQGLKANGLTGTLNKMIKATKGNQEQMATLLGDARAIRGAFSLAAEGGKEFTDELEIMKDAAGETDKAFGIQSKGAAFKLQQMKVELENAGIEIGNKFLPILVTVSGVVIDDVIPALSGIAAVLDLLSGKLPETEEGFKNLNGIVGLFNPASWTLGLGQLDELREKAEQSQKTVGEFAASVRYMADASKDDLYQVEQASDDTADAIGAISTAADDAKLAVDISFDEITASFKTMRDVIVGGGAAVAAALYDPIIAQQEILDTQEEIRANKKKIRDKETTAEERRQLELRNTQLNKQLIEQNALLLTYGTEAEQISKIKAFLAADFWVQAYEDATPEQAAALDDWRVTLQTRLDQMEGDAGAGGRRAADNYSGALEDGKGDVTSATDTMVSGMDGPFRDAQKSAYRYGADTTTSYANGLNSKKWYVADTAGDIGRIINKYLKISSPAELGPLSEDGGPGAWGARGAEVYIDGWADAVRRAYDAARALAGATAAGLGMQTASPAYAGPSLRGALSVPSAGVVGGLYGMTPSAGPVTKNIEYHIHAEGQLKVPDPLAAANLLARFQRQGMLPEDPDD